MASFSLTVKGAKSLDPQNVNSIPVQFNNQVLTYKMLIVPLASETKVVLLSRNKFHFFVNPMNHSLVTKIRYILFDQLQKKIPVTFLCRRYVARLITIGIYGMVKNTRNIILDIYKFMLPIQMSQFNILPLILRIPYSLC